MCFVRQELLDTLHRDPEEIRRQLSEAFRKLTVLRVNEKKLTRRYSTLLEREQLLRKENGKLRDESSRMQASVLQRMGYLQRYKVCMSWFTCFTVKWGQISWKTFKAHSKNTSTRGILILGSAFSASSLILLPIEEQNIFAKFVILHLIKQHFFFLVYVCRKDQVALLHPQPPHKSYIRSNRGDIFSRRQHLEVGYQSLNLSTWRRCQLFFKLVL